jgi:hypothetical protein
VSGKYTIDRRPILWKHRDSDFIHNKLVLFKEGKYDFIGLVNTSDSLNLEVWAGFNSAGFAIMNSASYNLNRKDTTQLKDQEGVVMKKALQTCATISDFENLLVARPKPLGVEANFGVIDATGGAAYYETKNDSFQKLDVNDPKQAPFGYLIRTNYSVTGEVDQGYGYIRYSTAEELFSQAAAMKQLSPRFMLQDASRCLKHSLTKSDLRNPLSYSANELRFVCFRDYIPRFSSVATVVVQGVRPDESPQLTTMWTILGFQLCSVAIPTWITDEAQLPIILTAEPHKNAPLCSWALNLKNQCFPIKRGAGDSYLNIAALQNEEGTGILQKLLPLENEILKKSNQNMEKWRQSGIVQKEVLEFYRWVDFVVTAEFQKITDQFKK